MKECNSKLTIIGEKLHCDLSFDNQPWRVFGDSPISEDSCKRTHVSLFSGCGGFDLGLRQAGFKTVFANDINHDACLTFQKNLGPIVEGDVRTVDLPEFQTKPDVLTAGFPCQPFSNAGSRKGKDDKRGTLYQTTIDIVEKIQPKSIVFENVRGLLSFRYDGKLLLEEICEQLDDLGYNVSFSLLDTSHYNVPQKRLRLFIVGLKKDGGYGEFVFPESIERDDLTLEHIIFDIPEFTSNQNELFNLNPQALQIGAMIPEGGSWKDIPYEKLPDRLKKIRDNIERYRWPTFYRKFRRDEISGTITASFKPENAGVWHPTENRVLSVREIARIQSFPDWFVFEGRSIKSKYQQIGNAVAPRMAYEIAVKLQDALNGVSRDKEESSLTFEEFLRSGRPLKTNHKSVSYSA